MMKEQLMKSVSEIKSEYSTLVPPLNQKEYAALKKSIKESKGNTVPIAVVEHNSHHIIIDGYHRFRACSELGIVPKIEIVAFTNKIQEKEFVIHLNLNRRHLNDFQKSELGYKLQEIEKEKARTRQLSHLNGHKSVKLGSDDHNGNNDKGKVVDIISRKISVSAKTYQRATKIIQHGSDQIKQKLREGKTTISKEYQRIQKDQKRTQLMNEATRMNIKNCQLF